MQSGSQDFLLVIWVVTVLQTLHTFVLIRVANKNQPFHIVMGQLFKYIYTLITLKLSLIHI